MKIASLSEFQSSIHRGGYEWVSLQSFESGLADLTDEAEMGQEVRCLAPASNAIEKRVPISKVYPGLFRKFADLVVDEQKVKDFADSFGFLGLAHGVGFMPDSIPLALVSGERLTDWQREAAEMKDTVDLFEAARRKDTERLKSRVRWDGRWVEVHLHPEQEPVAMEVAAPWDKAIRPGDLETPALHVVQAKVNKKMKELGVVPQLVWGFDLRQLRLELQPPSLLAALWVQLLNTINGDRHYLLCGGCKEWFEVHTQIRSNQLSCSEACRAKVYRMRKKERAKTS